MSGRTLILLIIAVIAFAVLGGVYGGSVTERRRAQCEALGGTYFTPRFESFCLRRDAVIELPR